MLPTNKHFHENFKKEISNSNFNDDGCIWKIIGRAGYASTQETIAVFVKHNLETTSTLRRRRLCFFIDGAAEKVKKRYKY